MNLIDTHCHIHSSDYPLDAEATYKAAIDAGLGTMICVGTDLEDSEKAIEFASCHDRAFAAVGIHPHESKGSSSSKLQKYRSLLENDQAGGGGKIVAVGEIGLDYHYSHSPKKEQTRALEAQLQLSVDYKLPVIFHVREAFDDFWPILGNFGDIKGVLHSFTDNAKNLHKALDRDFFIGVNGIVTFNASIELQALMPQIPLQKLLLETDSPYLTPVPHRGKVNEPAYVRLVADRISDLCDLSVEEIAEATSHNANTLFHI